MAVLFLIFLDQIRPKWIKLDQTWSKKVTIKSCHIYSKDKNGCFVFDFFWIRSIKNGSNLIKLDQIRFPCQSKMLLWKVVTFPERIKMAALFLIFWIRFVQNGSNLIKLDFLANLKMLLWKVVTFSERIKMAV